MTIFVAVWVVSLWLLLGFVVVAMWLPDWRRRPRAVPPEHEEFINRRFQGERMDGPGRRVA